MSHKASSLWRDFTSAAGQDGSSRRLQLRGLSLEALVAPLVVLNVIENPHERLETLKAAWSFAERVLTVAVMPVGKYQVSTLTPYKDGFLTNRGTFQRYFSQDDLREMVTSITGEAPISLAAGIVAAFRDKVLEQEVTYRRRSRAFLISERFTVPERPPRDTGARVIWRTIASLSAARVSVERAVAMCVDEFDPATLREAADGMISSSTSP